MGEEKKYRDAGTLGHGPISLCPACNCMTHTVDDKCGKCETPKPKAEETLKACAHCEGKELKVVVTEHLTKQHLYSARVHCRCTARGPESGLYVTRELAETGATIEWNRRTPAKDEGERRIFLQQQAQCAMHVVPDLLDVWREIPNDVKSDPELQRVAGHMQKLYEAMDDPTAPADLGKDGRHSDEYCTARNTAHYLWRNGKPVLNESDPEIAARIGFYAAYDLLQAALAEKENSID